MSNKKTVYLDFASLTPIDKEVDKETLKYNSINYGNPSAIYASAVLASKEIKKARQEIARALFAHEDEIIFTSGGTEANNLAILGLIKRLIKTGIAPTKLNALFSEIEHSSVLECARELSALGVRVNYIDVKEDGLLDVEDLRKKINPWTFLISVMLVNNEIGTIQPTKDVAREVRHARKSNKLSKLSGDLNFPIFHTDACQAPLYLKIDTRALGADLISADGIKMNGPRGIGILWKRRKINISPIILGGGQEVGLRSGTENLGAIAGLAKAFKLAEIRRKKDNNKMRDLQDYFVSKLKIILPNIVINGSLKERIASNINFSIPGIDNEFLVLQLDNEGICCSTKSSCLKGEKDSYVIKALGQSQERMKTSLRFSLGRTSSKTEIDFVIRKLSELINGRK